MYFSEKIKKEVVKKLLSSQMTSEAFAKKLKISPATIRKWRRQYSKKFVIEVVELPVEDNNSNLLDRLSAIMDSQEAKDEEYKLSIDKIMKKGKNSTGYTIREKIVIVETFNTLSSNEQGVWLRKYGLQSGHIKLWEKEIIRMAKKQFTEIEKIAKLEKEIAILKKKNSKLEKDKKELQKREDELKIMIQLKKKYSVLFEENEED